MRATLDAIGARIPLQTREVPSGTQVFDWQIPPEWSIEDAYIKDPSGRRIVDFRAHNLHVVNYSTPVRATMTLEELRPHLFSLPDHPDWIAYRTSYYRPMWGFCLTDRQLQTLAADVSYEVCIDSRLGPGSLTLAEAFFPGESSAEILLYIHACHPSLANDNLSAITVATAFAQRWQRRARPGRYGIRLVFGPATIGSIAWLALNEPQVPDIAFGLTLAGLGDAGPLTYKASRRGDAAIDRSARHVVQHRGGRCVDFSPYGYDERQFCSPGFDLPVGRLTRTPNGEYPAVPHLGRRPRLHHARRARAVARRARRDRRGHSAQRHLPQHAAEMRAAARAARPVPHHRRALAGRVRACACCGS